MYGNFLVDTSADEEKVESEDEFFDTLTEGEMLEINIAHDIETMAALFDELTQMFDQNFEMDNPLQGWYDLKKMVGC